MKKSIVIGGSVIIAAAIISPYFIGKVIENKFEQKITVLNKQYDKYFQIKNYIKLEYHAGWFTSEAKTIIGDKVIINHQITHGPYCFFGLGRIQSNIVLPESKQQALNTLFDGQQPYTITTDIGYTGTTYFNLHSPALTGEKSLPNDPNTKVTWQGLDIYYKFTKNKIESSIAIPKLVISEANKGAFTIEGIKSKSEWSSFIDSQLNLVPPQDLNINSTISIGKISYQLLNSYQPVTIEIGSITAQANTDNNNLISNFTIGQLTAAIGNTTVTTDTIKIYGSSTDPLWFFRKDLVKANWASNTTTDLQNIKINVPDQNTNVALNYHQEQTVSDANDNKISYKVLYKTTGIKAQLPNAYSNFIDEAEFGYSLNDLPKQQLASLVNNYIDMFKVPYMATLNNNSNNDQLMAQYQTKLMQSAQSLAINSLQGTPNVAAHLNIQGNKGVANLNFTAALTKPDTATQPQQLVMNAQARIKAKLALQLSEPLLDEVFKLADTPEEKVAEIKAQLTQKYPVINKQGKYLLDIEFKDKHFYVNDQLDPDFIKKYSQLFK